MKRILFFTTCFFVGMKLMAQSPVSFYPQENAQDINIDTHLVIEFDKAVKAGSKGVITVTDKTTRKVVDRIDMRIPAGTSSEGVRPTCRQCEQQLYRKTDEGKRTGRTTPGIHYIKGTLFCTLPPRRKD